MKLFIENIWKDEGGWQLLLGGMMKNIAGGGAGKGAAPTQAPPSLPPPPAQPPPPAVEPLSATAVPAGIDAAPDEYSIQAFPEYGPNRKRKPKSWMSGLPGSRQGAIDATRRVEEMNYANRLY